MSDGGYDNIRDTGLGEFIGHKLMDITTKFSTPEEFLQTDELDMVYFHFENGRTIGVFLRDSTLMMDPSMPGDEEDDIPS